VTDDLALPGIRSANEAATLAQIDCYRRSSARQYLTLSAIPQPSLEPGDVVTVTHWGGLSADGLGYRALPARLQRLAYVVDGAAVWCSIAAVDEPGVTLTAPGLSDTGRDPAPPPPGGQGVEATIVWQASSQSAASWTAGQVAVWGPSGWTLYNVEAGQTGTISSGRRYVYLDPDVDETHLLVASSLDAVAGGRRQLLATVTRGSTSYYVASIRAIAGQVRVDGYAMERSVSGSDIPSSTIHADHISAGSITASKISVSSLSAISANLGTITAGTITGTTIQTATSGARVVLDSTGFRSYDSGGNKLAEIPTSGGNKGMLVLTASDTTPGKIVFTGNSELYCNSAESATMFVPITDASGTFSIGTEYWNMWKDIFLRSSYSITSIAGSTTTYCYSNASLSPGWTVAVYRDSTLQGTIEMSGLDTLTSIKILSAGNISIEPKAGNASDLLLGVVDTRCWKAVHVYAYDVIMHYSDITFSTSTHIGPSTANSNTLYLGDSYYFWNYIYLYANTSINLISKGTVTIRPNTSGNGTLYLGSDSYKWDYIELNAYSSFGMGAKYSSSRYAGFNASSGGVDSTIFSYYDATHYAKILAHAESTFSSITFSSNRIGFFGASAAAKQTVSGSREGNAALASLLTALANYGLITNSTT